MTERYVVYISNSCQKLCECNTLAQANAFVDHEEAVKRKNGDLEFEKYEIVKVLRW